jgi:SAM-dependent methyltransferase
MFLEWVGTENGSMTISGDNEAQIQYWNAAAGEKWVRHQAFMDRQLEIVTDLLIETAAPRAGEAVLDVGCGTGATLLRLAAAVGTKGHVLGCDISAPMLAVAWKRIAAASVLNVKVVEADAQSHDFAESSFDLLVSRFGVMFFADPTAAFSNLHRAMRPGGRLAFVCWAPLADNPLFLLPMQIATRHLGPAEPMAPHAPGPLAFSDADYVRDILTGAGWSDVRIDAEQPVLLGSPTAQEQAAFSIEMGPVSRLIAERQPDAATAASLKADLTRELAPYATENGIQMPSRLFYVTGHKP